MSKYMLSLFFIMLTQLNAGELVKFNQELEGFKYPFPVETYSLKSQGQKLNMRYMSVGDPKAQKVVVLLHGKNFAGYYWERLAKDLVKQKYRVIIPDQIGWGKSTKPKYYQYSFGQLALNTKKLLNHLKINHAIILGHSMGGMLATTFANNHPEMLSQLILVNPIGLENYGQYAEFKDIEFFYQRELKASVEKARAYQRKNYYDGKWKSEYDQLLVPLQGMLNGGEWERVAWNNALTYGPIFSENILDRLTQIQTKTCLIIGTRDRTGPGRAWLKPGVERELGQYQKLGKEAHQLIPNSTLIELEGIGHMPHYENYPLFIQSLNQCL